MCMKLVSNACGEYPLSRAGMLFGAWREILACICIVTWRATIGWKFAIRKLMYTKGQGNLKNSFSFYEAFVVVVVVF